MRAFMRPSSVMRRIASVRRAAAYSSTASGKTTVDVEEMKSRPAKVILDYLTPTPSHLLDTLLSDLLGEQPLSSPTCSSSSSAASKLLPQGHHLVYFPLQTPASRLAADGADADHAPGPEFTRRLWAGGEVAFRRRRQGDGELVLDGRAWMCREKIEDVRVGGGGEKVFVDVWRRYDASADAAAAADGAREWDIEERRTLVFMRKPEDDSASTPSPPPRLIKCKSLSPPPISNKIETNKTDPHPPTHAASLLPTPPHLFHFSALTYNAHAIHIDPLHARRHDAHRALLVHGPLTLALMLRVLTAHLGGGLREVASLAYRNYAPLYVGERAKVCVRRVRRGDGGDGEQTWDVWVEGPEGGLAVKGEAVVYKNELP